MAFWESKDQDEALCGHQVDCDVTNGSGYDMISRLRLVGFLPCHQGRLWTSTGDAKCQNVTVNYRKIKNGQFGRVRVGEAINGVLLIGGQKNRMSSFIRRTPFVRKSLLTRLKTSTSSGANIPSSLYANVWKKSNILYITYVVVGCVILEGVYGGVTSSIWNTYNKGVRVKESLCDFK